MSTEQIAVRESAPFVKASTQLSAFLGIETGMMIETLKAQCFKGKRPEEVSDAQLAAFISVANVAQLNPLVPGMMYCYPERNGGITPIIGPDGVMKKIDEFIVSGKLNGYECTVFPPDASLPPTHAEAVIDRVNGQKPAKYTAHFKEWNVGSNPNWQTRPRHMLWIRAIKQAARQVIHGLPLDDDEYKIAQMVNVTPEGGADGDAEKPKRPAPKPREKTGVAAVKENPPQGGAIDIQATETPPGGQPPATATEAPPQAEGETTAPAEQPDKPKVPEPLKDGEKRTVIVKIEAVEAKTVPVNNRPTPSVKASVSGGFVGIVWHLNGVSPNGSPGPLWIPGTTVSLVILGKRTEKGGVGATVESIAEAQPAMAGESFA